MLEVGPDVMLSGGLRHWVPQSASEDAEVTDLMDGAYEPVSKRQDDRNLLVEAAEKGYGLAFNREQLEADQSDKLLGLFANSGMADGIEYRNTKSDADRSSRPCTR